MAIAHKLVIAAALLACIAGATKVSTGMTANPIRKVVTMLQMMENKVTAEGKKQEKMFEAYMCYCNTGEAELGASIEDAKTKIPQLESSLEETDAAAAQMVKDLDQHKTDREEAKKAIATATEVRGKEAATFASESGDYKANVAAMKKAIAAIAKGTGGSFLQTKSAAVLRQVTENAELSDTDRDVLVSFLSQSEDEEAGETQSGEILGILKQMVDTMGKDLLDITAAEETAIKDFDGMVAAKTKELNSLTASIEDKTKRIGDSGVEVVTLKEDIDDTSKALTDDTAFLADLQKNCAAQKEGYAIVQKTRSEELLAIADTIKILNDDDALEMFKKALPGASSFLQMQVTSKEMRRAALKSLKQHGHHHDYRLDLISLALRGKKVNFDKVLGMVDDMVTLLGKEQDDDDSKKNYCEDKLDKTEDALKEVQRASADLGKDIEEAKSNLAQIVSDIAALGKGIEDLDKQVAEATEQRKEEHSDYENERASNTAAKDLIGFAKNRMAKFYNPKQYKAAPKRELSEEDRITLNMGGTLAPTAAPGGIAGTGISFMQTTARKGAPPPPPAAVGAYASKKDESGGVMGMMDMMIGDVENELAEMEVNEKHAQEEYEQLVKDSGAKRAADSQAITDKENAKAGTEESLVKLEKNHKSKLDESMATAQYLGDLHEECDWLLQNFDTRREARAGEVESLKKAKSVLSGADFSLVQIHTSHAVAHHLRG